MLIYVVLIFSILTLCFATIEHAEAAKVEFANLLPDYSIEFIPTDRSAGAYGYRAVFHLWNIV